MKALITAPLLAVILLAPSRGSAETLEEAKNVSGRDFGEAAEFKRPSAVAAALSASRGKAGALASISSRPRTADSVPPAPKGDRSGGASRLERWGKRALVGLAGAAAVVITPVFVLSAAAVAVGFPILAGVGFYVGAGGGLAGVAAGIAGSVILTAVTFGSFWAIGKGGKIR